MQFLNAFLVASLVAIKLLFNINMENIDCPLDKSSRTEEILDLYIKNHIFSFYSSRNNKKCIFSIVNEGESPELYTISGKNKLVTRITNNKDIEFDPVINDNGDYAFSLHQGKVGESIVSVNGEIIELSLGLHKNLAINDKVVAGYSFNLSLDRSEIFVYDIHEKKIENIPIDFYVDDLFIIDTGDIVASGITRDKYIRTSYLFNSNKEYSREPIEDHGRTCAFVRTSETGKDLKCVTQGTVRHDLLERAIRHLRSNDPALALACSNNDLGRISWYVAYRLRALIKLNQLVSQEVFPSRRIAAYATNCLLTLAEDTRKKQRVGWPTTKYSLDGSTLDLMVDNATILHALLTLVNEGLLAEDQAARVVQLGEEMFAYYEVDFDQFERSYRFRKGTPVAFDGVSLPFNMQNEFGAALVELYQATGNELYRIRVFQLAENFRKSWKFTREGSVLWHYWPNVFYRGWNESDDISVNTPKREPTEDNLYEDISHSGHNVHFILSVNQNFPDGPISSEDIAAIAQTLERARVGDLYSSFMSGDIEYQKPSVRFVPTYGWTEIADRTLATQVSFGIPSASVFFDGDDALIYLSLMNSAASSP